jgi:hypothetical protein
VLSKTILRIGVAVGMHGRAFASASASSVVELRARGVGYVALA